MVPLTTGSQSELDTVLSVVTWVFDRVQAYIGICNAHVSLWIPTGFAIAGVTIWLFKSAMGLGSNRNY